MLIKTSFKRDFFCLVLLSTFILSSFAFKYAFNDCKIQWSADKPLKREDFKGKIFHKNAVASTVYSIQREVSKVKEGSVLISIKTYFFCDKSWMLKDTCGNDVILHEQKHFDIAEIFARKLRRSAQKIEAKNLKDAEYKLDSLYKMISQAMDVYQDTYDTETDHSIKTAQQKKWSQKISSNLHELDAYKETDLTLKIKAN